MGWRAFCQGTTGIIVLWAISTTWAFTKIIDKTGWRTDFKPEDPGKMVSSVMPIWDSACNEPLLSLRTQHTGLVRATAFGQDAARPWQNLDIIRSPPLKHFAFVDRGCGFRQPSLELSMACQGINSERPQCIAAFPHRGGRSVTVCRVQWRGTSPGFVRMASFRLPLEFPPVMRLAVGWNPVAPTAARASVRDVRFAARTTHGALIILQLAESEMQGGRRRLVPSFEIESAQGPTRGSGKLVFVDNTLFSIVSAAREAGFSQCASASRPRLDAWDLSSGQSWHSPESSWSSPERIGLDNVLSNLCRARRETA